MDVYNKEAVQAVWARVTASKEQSLEEFCVRTQQAGEIYRQLATRFPKHRSVFLTLARDENRHAKQLSALYYLQFGCAVFHKAEPVKLSHKLCEAIRECYHRETGAVQRYTAAAEQFPDQRSLFLSLSAESARHAERLMALLQTVPFNM